ncbi:MaoC family dehydratase [Loktanella sp. M215]|uniref:MaoC family dehydratase n=1 Tax=Loktanella sp. M215 TaxID=2675431 RepID=UPI001F1E311D|nr:MaoC family dehydratase [Loktanella sp. M215]MCF7697874.1 MaoC family dehydratase [Loktanella sp. M215]
MDLTLTQMTSLVGKEVGLSAWHRIDQPLIDAFAKVSGDTQFIHTDPGRAAATPFGGTIAHGFLTVSLLSTMAAEAQPQLAGLRMSVNYGFDRLRFISPVPVDSDIRARFALAALDERQPGEVTVAWDVTVEIRGQDKPALIARWLNRRYLDAA